MSAPGRSTRLRLWAPMGLAVGLGVNAGAQTAATPSAADFAMVAMQSDQFEICAAQDAVAQSRNPQVRAFAHEMIQDHMRMSENVRAAALASGLTPPPTEMNRDQAAMLSALQSLRGADFDKAYARQQVLAHDQALAVQSQYAAGGADAQLRAVARSAAIIVQRHLGMARQIASALGDS